MSLGEPTLSARYDAFISYSHQSDNDFAPRFQDRLEAFARKGRTARALRVFRDDANLAANPDLWHGIEEALSSSAWFVLLASPQAAESPWIGKEIQWWLANRSAERMLIGLTDGRLAWDGGDFDAASTVHPELRGALPAEPRWIDLRGLRSMARLDDDDPRVQQAVAEFAAPLRGVEKDQLIGEHVSRLRRDKRRVRRWLATLVVLSLVAVTGGVAALVLGQQAQERARVATARLLAATAVKESPTDAARANLLAAEGYRLHRDAQTEVALFQVVNDNQALVVQHQVAAPVTALAASPRGIVLAGTTDGRLIRWDPASGRETRTRLGNQPVTDVAITDDGTVAAATDGRRAVVWRPGADPVALELEEPGQVALSPQGTTAVVVTAATVEPQWLRTFDAKTGTQRGETRLADEYWEGLGLPDEQTIAVTSGAGVWQRLRLADLAVTLSQQEKLAPPSRGISATSDDGSFTGFHAGFAAVLDTAMDQRQELRFSGVDAAFTADAFAIRRDGERTAAGGGGRLFVSDVGDRNDRYNPTELLGAGGADHVVFVGDSTRLVTAKGATLSLWDSRLRSRLRLGTTGLRVPETPASSNPTRMAVSPDGTRIVLVGGFGTVVVYGPSTDTTVPSPDGTDYFPAWLPDGTPALIGRLGCGLYAIRRGKIMTVLAPQGVHVVAARLTADGKDLVCVSEYGGMSVRRLSDAMYIGHMPGAEEKLTENFTEVGLAAISADGRYGAWITGRNDGRGRLTVVDSVDGTTVTVPGRSKTVDFAGDRLLVSHADGSLDVRDASGATLRRTIPGNTLYADALSWVPGTPFVGRVRNDGNVVVFDVDSGATLGVLTLPLPEGPIATRPWEATGIVGVGATGELVTATPESTIARWAMSEPAWLDIACRFAGRDLRPEEWRDVAGGDPPDDLSCHR